MNKASDECGLVAELLHFAPDNVVTALLGINVNVNPVCFIGEPVSGTGGKLRNYFLYTSTLAKLRKNSGRFERQSSISIP